ncbi:S41 family peptidase [Halotia wernerae UHCC 0503]|jgi:carboxyl-terminal processing protease|nr:S41 family peptidase [Halotia wernerae UHCC 0503]
MRAAYRPSSLRKPRSRLGVLAAALVLFATACAGPRETVRPEQAAVPAPRAAQTSPTQFFHRAYDELAVRYIQPIDMPVLASTGLGGLSKIDQRISVKRTDTRLQVMDGAIVAASYDLPRRDDALRWAQLTAAAIDSARNISPALRDTSNERVFRAVLDEALAPLDAYTRYDDPDRARDARASRDGFGGIGVTVGFEQGEVRVDAVTPDSPAARGGIRVGDRLVAADGRAFLGMPERDVIARLRGPIGSEVRIEIRRPPAETRSELKLTRSHIVSPTVTYRRDGDIAYLRVTGFNQRTTDALTDAVRRAKAEIGPNMRGAVLDLRGNLGGLLDQAVGVSDLFLARGTIVSTRGRHRGALQSMTAQPGDIGENVPLVVLVNGQSASASEIVAAALQDNGRAVVVGTTSFGKGSVQTLVPMPNDGELVITWARFHAPTGYPLADLGVIPAVCTSGNDQVATALQAINQGRTTGPDVMVRWRAADHSDMDGLKRLRQICAPENTNRESDLGIAEALLRDRTLFSRAIESVQLAAEAR